MYPDRQRMVVSILTVGRSPWFLAPAGATDNSPAFQRWVGAANDHPVPAGTTEVLSSLPGLANRDHPEPSDESLGYFHTVPAGTESEGLRPVFQRLGRTMRLACFVCLFAQALSASGCRQQNDLPSGAPSAASPAKVAVVQPQRKSIKRLVEQPGAIKPFEETHLFARVHGYVSKINVDIGQKVSGPKVDAGGREVEPGQVLAEIAVPEMEEEAKQKKALIKQAEAEVEQARKALASAEATIATAEAGVSEAKANRDRWESESKRVAGLAKNGVLDVQAQEETLNQYRATSARFLFAEAMVRKVKADRDKAAADVQSAEARVDVAKAEAARVDAMVGYAKIRAPYAGVVTRRRVNTGDLVQPNSAKGESLFTVARWDPVRVVVDVPEADAGLVQDKSEVKLSIQAFRTQHIIGTITRTAWALEPGSRTLRTEIDLPNKDGQLRPGMYVYAHIVNQYPESWTLPASAIVKHGDMMVCFQVEGEKAVRTPVQIGRADGQDVEVLKRQRQGLPIVWEEFTGNEMIAAQASGLTDGQTIQKDAGK